MELFRQFNEEIDSIVCRFKKRISNNELRSTSWWVRIGGRFKKYFQILEPTLVKILNTFINLSKLINKKQDGSVHKD